MGDHHGFFHKTKLVQLEETKRVESQSVRDEEGRLLRDKGRIREKLVQFFRSLLNAKSDMLDPDIPKRLPQHSVASALGMEATEEEIATTMKAMTNAKAVGLNGLPARTADTLTSARSDHPTGAPSAYHPHLARGESPAAVERHGRNRTPQEGRQDGVRKLPRHLARVTCG